MRVIINYPDGSKNDFGSFSFSSLRLGFVWRSYFYSHKVRQLEIVEISNDKKEIWTEETKNIR